MTDERRTLDPVETTIETTIPGRAPIELVAYYGEFRDYYPYCELETKRWFVDHVRADWWMFDIGANVGYYTILFSQLAPRGRVFAFEPTATAEMLRANLRHNKVENAEIHEVALAATTGEREDRIYRLWGTDGEVRTWPFSSLDDFIERHRIERVDCLKIDVDSFDFDVLRGAERTLAERNPVIVVELNHALALRNQGVGEALAWLARRGYRKALVLDNDNFMLQRGAGSLVDAGAVSSLELSFPPPLRFDEAMPTSAGQPVGDAFIGKVDVKTDVVVARQETEARRLISRVKAVLGRDDSLAFRDVAGVPIETTAVAWNYALVLGLNPDTAPGVVTIEVAVEVMDGKLGIALAGVDSSRFCAPERTLAAMPLRQSIVVSAKAADVRFLVFRTVAPDGVRTRFKVLSIETRWRSVAPRAP
jgi:FkbM family methyltransferase